MTVGDSGSQSLADSLTVLTWGGSYGKAVKNSVIKMFQEDKGVKINHGVFGNDFDAIAKQKAGGGGDIDVIMPGVTGTVAAVNQDLLHPLRTENIPNTEALMDRFKLGNLSFDPGPEPHVVNWDWGCSGTVYNTKHYSSDPEKWADLFTEETSGRVAFNNISWLAAGPVSDAGFSLGIDMTDLSNNFSGKMDRIFGKLEEWDKHMLRWYSSNATMVQMLINEEMWGGVAAYGRFNTARESGAPIEFTVSKSGAPFWADNWAIAKGTQRRYTAERFINYSLTQKAHREYNKLYPYPGPIKLDNPPELVAKNPVPDHLDRVKVVDIKTIYEHRKDIQKRFQTMARS